MTFAIRPAIPKDFPALEKMFAEVDRLHLEALPRLFRAPNGQARSSAYLHGVVEDPDQALHVAVNLVPPEELLGFALVQLKWSDDFPIIRPRRYAVLDVLFIDPNQRRRGLGKALVEAARQWAREKNAQDLELRVYEFNREALAFYKSLGFEVKSHEMISPLGDPS